MSEAEDTLARAEIVATALSVAGGRLLAACFGVDWLTQPQDVRDYFTHQFAKMGQHNIDLLAAYHAADGEA